MRGKNSREREYWCEQMTSGQVHKVSCMGQEIRIASPNIWLGRAGRMEVALQALKQGSVDVGVLQETNPIKGIHT